MSCYNHILSCFTEQKKQNIYSNSIDFFLTANENKSFMCIHGQIYSFCLKYTRAKFTLWNEQACFKDYSPAVLF